MFSAITHIISNIIAIAVCAVILFGLSFVGIIQTISPPITFMPRVSLTKLIASSISKPLELASKFATPGAIVGSRQSRSNVIYTGLPVSYTHLTLPTKRIV